MSFIRVAYRNLGEGSLTDKKNESNIASLPKPLPAWVTNQQSWEPGTPCIAYKKLTRLERVFSKWLGQLEPLCGCFVGLGFIKVFQYSSQSDLSESDDQCSLACILRRKGPGESGQFWGFPETVLSYFSLKKLSYRLEYFNPQSGKFSFQGLHIRIHWVPRTKLLWLLVNCSGKQHLEIKQENGEIKAT